MPETASAAPGIFDEDFLLTTRQSCRLYHDVAKQLPIIDYHCHLPPRDLATNRTFAHPTEIWLEGDHYKWRAMRANGVDERYITGDASPRDKFMKWAETVPQTVLNPLFHWTHLELKRPFGIQQWLTPASAAAIWTRMGKKLQTPALSAHGILKSWKVELVGTTDDPADDLLHHRHIKDQGDCPAEVIPTFRPDRGINPGDPASFRSYVDALGAAANLTIRSYDDFVSAHETRMDAFAALGCRMSDHALEAPPEEDFTGADLRRCFRTLVSGKPLSAGQSGTFRAGMLYHLGKSYAARGWIQQFHIGALRNVTTRMAKRFGSDAGCDTIGDRPVARGLACILDRLDREDHLPKTILYNLNPADNEVFAAMAGNFQGGGIPGKIQYGSAWWFLDQKDGMERQMNALANMGLISRFIGMITDSRSFLSYSRHEYFRRIVCDLFGRAMKHGQVPHDLKHIGSIVEAICYRNAKTYCGVRS
ncbi:MAG TPA: glucuronate isomerase [Kiritimatiellia bacterium]|nr:glucuronate isomerase [Kiritimatiellia bacterium]